MTKVFIPQIPTRRNEEGIFVPKYDLTSASLWGVISPILPPGNIRHNEVASAHRTIVLALESGFSKDDYILLMGDPLAQAMVVATIAQQTDIIKILKYDRHNRVYYSQQFDVTF